MVKVRLKTNVFEIITRYFIELFCRSQEPSQQYRLQHRLIHNNLAPPQHGLVWVLSSHFRSGELSKLTVTMMKMRTMFLLRQLPVLVTLLLLLFRLLMVRLREKERERKVAEIKEKLLFYPVQQSENIRNYVVIILHLP